MTERLGQTFDGVISGVTEWGLYVELNENKCEGMIPIRDLDDDYYEFDEKNYCLRGRVKTGYTAWETPSPSKWHAPIWRRNNWILHWYRITL